jgi:hypothetical protein
MDQDLQGQDRGEYNKSENSLSNLTLTRCYSATDHYSLPRASDPASAGRCGHCTDGSFSDLGRIPRPTAIGHDLQFVRELPRVDDRAHPDLRAWIVPPIGQACGGWCGR